MEFVFGVRCKAIFTVKELRRTLVASFFWLSPTAGAGPNKSDNRNADGRLHLRPVIVRCHRWAWWQDQTSAASILISEQNKQHGNNRKCKHQTYNERNQRMPTALEPSGLGALLRCSKAKPEWKIAHCPRSSRRRSSSDRSIGVGVRSRVRCHPCLATCVSFPTSYVLLLSLHGNPDSDIVLYRYHCILDGLG
jgi:hypothetical protein